MTCKSRSSLRNSSKKPRLSRPATANSRRSDITFITCYGIARNGEDYHKGITNYVTFLDIVDRWRYRTQDQVCYVTFNYDRMLEGSMNDLWGCTFSDFEAYTSNDRFKLIKLHGSVDWGLAFEVYAGQESPRDVIRNAATKGIDVSQMYRKVEAPPVVCEDGLHGFPALAIPVEKKSVFSCPPEHLRVLSESIPKVSKIITIGWRATEDHFIAMLKSRLTGLRGDVDLMIVSGSEAGAKQTNENLGLANVSLIQSCEMYGGGFSGLITNIDVLEKFLQLSAPNGAQATADR